ncbi:MAG: tRNA dihydrouridine synthase DusB [Fibrobacteria bacterium]|nr:tRNA dihydrouridine synthase DusB [Fibrobacteria bacterium]
MIKSFSFGDKRIYPNVFLAPMSGVSDLPFRRLVSDLAGGNTGLLVSEFISVEGMTRFNPRVCKQVRFTEEQRPYMVQIFGANPDRMEMGAKMVEESGADFVEINAGCPAPKVVKKGGGSGLLRDLAMYKTIIQKVVGAVNIPVSIKVRIGYTEKDINILETLKIAEGEGIQMFVIHGRTRQQGYRGLANWDYIAKAKAQASIPVIGNGDVLTVDDVTNKLTTSGVDGICIGRGAMHNPWIFKQVYDLYEGREPHEPTLAEQEQAFVKLSQYLTEEFEFPGIVLGRMKQVTARMVKCLPRSKQWRIKLLRSETLEEYFEHLHNFYNSFEGTTSRTLQELRDLNGRSDNDIQFGKDYNN